jgi:hypothetical protein
MRVVKGAHVVALGRARDASNARLHSEIGLAQATAVDENLLCAMLSAGAGCSLRCAAALTCCRLNGLQQRVFPLGQCAFRHHGRV